MSRRTGLVLVAAVVILFVIELVALAFGLIVLAVACAAAFTLGWFVLRGWMRRTGRG